MERSEILEIINVVMKNKGRSPITDENMATREAQFRSLDFSETALRIEARIGRELTFDALPMRRVAKIGDVLDFFEMATKQK
jgi:acyl carrier protein